MRPQDTQACVPDETYLPESGTIGDHPATGWSSYDPLGGGDSNDGLTKREWFAGMALQGLLASDVDHEYTDEMASNLAVEQAESLIKALNKDKP